MPFASYRRGTVRSLGGLLLATSAMEDLREREACVRERGHRHSAPRSSADRATSIASWRRPRRARSRPGQRGHLDRPHCRRPSWRSRATPPPRRPFLTFEGPGDQEPFACLVRQISHLPEHGVCLSRLTLGRLVVLGQHLDERRHVGAVCLLVAETEVVHDGAGLCDRRARGVELAGERFERLRFSSGSSPGRGHSSCSTPRRGSRGSGRERTPRLGPQSAIAAMCLAMGEPAVHLLPRGRARERARAGRRLRARFPSARRAGGGRSPQSR